MIYLYKLDNYKMYYQPNFLEYLEIIKEAKENYIKYIIVKRDGNFYHNKKRSYYHGDNIEIFDNHSDDYVIEIILKENYNPWYSDCFLLICSDEHKINEIYDYITL